MAIAIEYKIRCPKCDEIVVGMSGTAAHRLVYGDETCDSCGCRFEWAFNLHLDINEEIPD